VRESFITSQIKPDASEQDGRIFDPIRTALERLDFAVQSFDGSRLMND
jgi:hypothetical protein